MDQCICESLTVFRTYNFYINITIDPTAAAFEKAAWSRRSAIYSCIRILVLEFRHHICDSRENLNATRVCTQLYSSTQPYRSTPIFMGDDMPVCTGVCVHTARCVRKSVRSTAVLCVYTQPCVHRCTSTVIILVLHPVSRGKIHVRKTIVPIVPYPGTGTHYRLK